LARRVASCRRRYPTSILRVIILGEELTFTDATGIALIILRIGFYAWSDARAVKARRRAEALRR